jgi:hypothetical protein
MLSHDDGKHRSSSTAQTSPKVGFNLKFLFLTLRSVVSKTKLKLILKVTLSL